MNQIQRDQRNFTLLTNEIILMKDAIDGYTRKVSKPHVAEKLINECRERIYKAALHLTDFNTASEYASTPEHKDTIRRLKKALVREEHENCKCEEDVLFNERGQTNITKFVKFWRVFDQSKGYWVDIYKCVKCRFMTTRTTGAHFEASNRLEAARNAVGSKKKDVEVL